MKITKHGKRLVSYTYITKSLILMLGLKEHTSNQLSKSTEDHAGFKPDFDCSGRSIFLDG